MPTPYYSLLQRDPDGVWSLQWSSYRRIEVSEEARDYRRRERQNPRPWATFHVVRLEDDTAAAVDAEVARRNQQENPPVTKTKKCHLIFAFPVDYGSDKVSSRVIGILPFVEGDGSRGLPAWFFRDYEAPVSLPDGSILPDERWMYDSLQFWSDGYQWIVEWIPQIRPAPYWETRMSPTFSPLDFDAWWSILSRLASWQRRVYGGANRWRAGSSDTPPVEP